MDFNDPKVIKAIEYYVERTAQRIVNKELRKFRLIRAYSAKVSSVNEDDTINVTLPGQAGVLQSIKNKTNQTLSAGDEVYLYSIGGLTNCFVGVTKK